MGLHEMTWEHATEHVQPLQDSPAAGAPGYAHGLTRRRTRGTQGGRRDSADECLANIRSRNLRRYRRVATAAS